MPCGPESKVSGFSQTENWTPRDKTGKDTEKEKTGVYWGIKQRAESTQSGRVGSPEPCGPPSGVWAGLFMGPQSLFLHLSHVSFPPPGLKILQTDGIVQPKQSENMLLSKEGPWFWWMALCDGWPCFLSPFHVACGKAISFQGGSVTLFPVRLLSFCSLISPACPSPYYLLILPVLLFGHSSHCLLSDLILLTTCFISNIQASPPFAPPSMVTC